jgi:endogenous inhibitor of DNA gyrase (YacG/DUF329 family)
VPKVKSECKQCGKSIEYWPSQVRSFCSQSCRSQHNAIHGAMPTKPRRGTTSPCETCGKSVYKSKGQTKKRYCSQECHYEGLKVGHEEPCQACGKPMWVVPSTPQRFCGRDCYENARIKSSGIGRMHNGREVIRDSGGYLRLWEPDHPKANQGRVTEHRWLVEQALGRYLRTEEHVHHVNGVKDDNRLENLQVLGAQEHRLLTAAEIKTQRAADAAELAEYRKRYGPIQ